MILFNVSPGSLIVSGVKEDPWVTGDGGVIRGAFPYGESIASTAADLVSALLVSSLQSM